MECNDRFEKISRKELVTNYTRCAVNTAIAQAGPTYISEEKEKDSTMSLIPSTLCHKTFTVYH